MTRKIFAVLIAIYIIILALFVILFKNYIPAYSNEVQNQDVKYHLQVYVLNDDGYLTTEFKKGALQAAENNQVYVEFITYTNNDAELLQQLADQSVYSKVDGVAIKIFELESGQNAVEEFLTSEIKVVVYESEYYAEEIKANSDHANISDIYTTGSNTYNRGYLAGQLIIDSSNRNVTAAIITNRNIENEDLMYRSSITLGIQDAFSQQADISCKIETVYNQDGRPAEQIVSTILAEYPDVNTFICLDEKSTPAITQALVDSNKVGQINVVGYGMLPLTLDYIRRGVISGTIYPDSEAIGYDTVEALVKMLDGETVSDIGYQQAVVVTKDNVDDYIQE